MLAAQLRDYTEIFRITLPVSDCKAIEVELSSDANIEVSIDPYAES